jgi:glutathione S-transferase
MPALVDHAPADGGPPISVFESGAIMMYLAENAGRFYPQDIRRRYEVNQWVIWRMANQGPKLGECGRLLRLGNKQGDQSYAVRPFTDEANKALWRSQQSALRSPLSRRRRIHNRRHDQLSMDCELEGPGASHPRVQIFQTLV